MRVQRTRSSASPPHSPLTRRPLGGRSSRWQKAAVLILLLLIAWLGSVATTAEPSLSGQVEHEILGLEDQWRVAQHTNDAAAFMTLLSPDLTFIGTSGSLRNRADYVASRAGSWIPRARSYEYSELHVRVFGPVAVVTGREATTGEGVAFQGRFTHVWAEQAGVWRLVAIQRTDIADAKTAQ